MAVLYVLLKSTVQMQCHYNVLQGIKKMTTSPDEEPTTPAEKMSNIRHRRGAGKKYGNGYAFSKY